MYPLGSICDIPQLITIKYNVVITRPFPFLIKLVTMNIFKRGYLELQTIRVQIITSPSEACRWVMKNYESHWSGHTHTHSGKMLQENAITVCAKLRFQISESDSYVSFHKFHALWFHAQSSFLTVTS